MSTNLHLRAFRTVTTKLGREVVQEQKIDLYHTPTLVTDRIMALPTFNEQLEAYGKWADERDSCYSGDIKDIYKNGEWWEIYDDSYGRTRETYMTFDREIEQHGRDSFYNDRIIKRVVLKGEPEFDLIQEHLDKDWAFIHHNPEQNHLAIGYRLVQEKPPSELLKSQIEKLTEEEYEFEFYPL